uniref:Uncharacterized protein n=1 Tax=Pan troglodytes TaxID=9598 RepID=G2HI47_PANTR|nr:hypothetical protein [Pan troglodytes]
MPPERRGFGTQSTQQSAVEAQPRIKTLGFLSQAPQPAGGHTARGPWEVKERGAPASPTLNGQQGHKGSPGQGQPPATRPLQNPRSSGDSERADCRAPTGSTHQTQRPRRKAVRGPHGVHTPDTEATQKGGKGPPRGPHTRHRGHAERR